METITLKRENQMDLQFQGEEISHAQGPDIDEDRVRDFDDPNYDPYPACYDYTLYKTADSVKSCNYVLYIVMYISAVMFDESPGKVETYQSLEELRENFLKRDNHEKKGVNPLRSGRRNFLPR